MSIFEFHSYKTYLEARVGPRTQRRGIKSALAGALRCQPTYISQVLHGQAHLSPEQGALVNDFFGHSKEEGHFFLLLLLRDRASTEKLRVYFGEQIEAALSRRMLLTARLGARNQLQEEDRARYYGSWHYAAVHIALTVPGLSSPKSIANYFKMPLGKVNEVLQFLREKGLAVQREDSFTSGDSFIRLGNDSPLIYRHHSNWRVQTMEALDREGARDLHYSGVVSLSQNDAIRLKDKMLERLKEDIAMIRESPGEDVYAYCLDFFTLQR